MLRRTSVYGVYKTEKKIYENKILEFNIKIILEYKLTIILEYKLYFVLEYNINNL